MTHYNAICQFCGKFMSYKQMDNGIEYTPFGSYYDWEPPEPEFIHRDCWERETDRQRLIKAIAWTGPSGVRS